MKKKRIKGLLSLMLCIVMVLSCATFTASAENKMNFEDVTESDWFYSDVKYAFENGLMNGNSETKFDPNGTMTRAMFVTVIGRLCNAVQVETNEFPDVVKNDDSSWYYGYVGWGAQNGIVTGDEHGFRPNDYILREEATAVIVRVIKYLGLDATWNPDVPSVFADAESISSWAANYVEELRTSGIITGDPEGNFNPKGKLNRAEGATILSRLHRMKTLLTLEGDVRVSYMAENGDYYILNAYDLYYSGSALTTGYSGSLVDESGEYPLLSEYADGRTHMFRSKMMLNGRSIRALVSPPSGVAEGNYFALDTQILGISLNDYSYVRVGYISDADISVGLDAKDIHGSFEPEITVSDGMKHAVVNVKVLGGWSESDPKLTVSFMTGDDTKDISVSYVAFFRTKAEADAFIPSENAEVLNTNRHTSVELLEFTDELESEYMAEINAKIEEIKELPDIDPATVKGTCYYVSSINGDDSNDGLSPETPFKTFNGLYDIKGPGLRISKAEPGDAVFFERGSVFTPTFTTNQSGDYVGGAEKGVIYSAYGEGEKPLFTQALDLNGSMDWVRTEYDNIWKLNETLPYKPTSPTYYDIGNIAIEKDGEEYWGVKLYATVPKDVFKPGAVSDDLGIVTNGMDYFDCPSRPCEDPTVLQNNLEYIQDYETGTVYMYFDMDGVSPGEYFDSIILSRYGDILGGSSDSLSDAVAAANPTVMHNLVVKYGGSCGFGVGGLKNFRIEGCEAEWIGGSFQGGEGIEKVRFGNGIQNWGNCEGFLVRNCYINQVYDAGITTQGGYNMVDVIFEENVLVNCNMAFEVFAYTGDQDFQNKAFENTFIRENYILRAGYGFGNSTPNAERKGTFLMGFQGMSNHYPWYNVVFEDNLCMYTAYSCAWDVGPATGAHTDGQIYRNNIYIANTAVGYYGSFPEDLYRLAYDTNSSRCHLPYTQQYLQYLVDCGIDTGSTFYGYTDFLYEYEEGGVYRYPEDK